MIPFNKQKYMICNLLLVHGMQVLIKLIEVTIKEMVSWT